MNASVGKHELAEVRRSCNSSHRSHARMNLMSQLNWALRRCPCRCEVEGIMGMEVPDI